MATACGQLYEPYWLRSRGPGSAIEHGSAIEKIVDVIPGLGEKFGTMKTQKAAPVEAPKAD